MNGDGMHGPSEAQLAHEAQEAFDIAQEAEAEDALEAARAVARARRAAHSPAYRAWATREIPAPMPEFTEWISREFPELGMSGPRDAATRARDERLVTIAAKAYRYFQASDLYSRY